MPLSGKKTSRSAVLKNMKNLRSRTEKAELLRGIRVFARAGRRELEALAAQADELVVPAGRTILRQGTSGRELVVILDGEADVLRDGRVINRIGSGEVAGEIALLSRGPRTATVRTTKPTRLLVLTDLAYRSLVSDKTRDELRAVARARVA
jgi:CRP-like cAMP-binding protein